MMMDGGKQQERPLAGEVVSVGAEVAIREARVRRRLIALAKVAFLVVFLALLLPTVLSYAYYAESRTVSDSVDEFSEGEMNLTTVVQVGGEEGVQLVAMGLSVEPHGWVTETVSSDVGANPQYMPNNDNYWADAMAVLLPPPYPTSTIPPRIIFVGGLEYDTEDDTDEVYSSRVYTTTIIVSNTRSISAEIYSNSLTDWVEQSDTVDVADGEGGIAGAALVLYKKDAATSYLYLIGGYNYEGSPIEMDIARSKVYSATVNNATGEVGGWKELAYSVPCQDPGNEQPGLMHPSSVIDEDVIYVVGGAMYPDIEGNLCDNGACYSRDVYTATIIASTGGLTATNFYSYLCAAGYWNIIENALILTGTVGGGDDSGAYYGAAVKYSGENSTTVYYIGGLYDTDNNGSPDGYSPYVFFGDISPEGYLSFTKSLSGLVQGDGIYGHGAANTREQLVILGGIGSNDVATGTVQAALADESDAPTRLFDFCGGISPCEFGSRWLLGEEDLPRWLYGQSVVEWDGHYFLLGGDYKTGGSDKHSNLIYHGTVNGQGAHFAPSGYYTSKEFQPAGWGTPVYNMRAIRWEVTLSNTVDAGLQMEYITWTHPSAPPTTWNVMNPTTSHVDGVHRVYTYTFSPPSPVDLNTRFKYRGYFTSTYPYTSTARLTKVTVYYDLTSPDLKISKSSDITIASPGDTVTYTLLCTNTSSTAIPARITDTLPKHVYIENNTANWQGSWGVAGGTIYTTVVMPGWFMPYFPENIEFTAKVAVPISTGDSVYTTDGSHITNTVEITYDGVLKDKLGEVVTDPFPYDNQDEWGIELRKLWLDMSKTGFSPTAQPTELITYTIVVTAGDSPEEYGTVRNLFITDTLPISDYLHYQFCSSEGDKHGSCGETSPGSGIVTWSLKSDAISPQEPLTLYVGGYVVKPLTDGLALNNQAEANSYMLFSPASDNASIQVAATPNLGIYKSANPAPGSPVAKGQTIEYALEISNTGGTPATSVVVTDTFDGDFSITSIQPAPGWGCSGMNGSALTCTTSYLGVDNGFYANSEWGISGTHSITFYIRIGPGVTTGTFTNTAYIRSAEVGTTESNKVSHEVVAGELRISKGAQTEYGKSYVVRGERITYTLHYTNLGGTDANTTTLTDTFSPYASLVAGSCNPAGCDLDGNDLSWNLGSVAPGSYSAIFSVRVTDTASAKWDIANNCEIVSPDAGTSYCAEVKYEIGDPLLKMFKSSDPPSGGQVLNNSPIAYNIHHWNDGESALNTIITDIITGPVTFNQSQNPGWNLASVDFTEGVTVTVLTYSLGTYPSDAPGTYTPLVVRTNQNADWGEIVTDTAYIYSPDMPDPGLAQVVGTNTVTHEVVTCTTTAMPNLEIIALTPSQFTCIFTDTALTFGVTLYNNSDTAATSSPSGDPLYGTFIVEVHTMGPLSGTQVYTPDNHLYGYCPDTKTCDANSHPERDKYLFNSYYCTGGYSMPGNGECSYTFFSDGGIKLEQTGVWTINTFVDVFFQKFEDEGATGDPDWGFVQEGCWEGYNSNLRSVTVEVLDYSQKSNPACSGGGAGGGPYLPLILKNSL